MKRYFKLQEVSEDVFHACTGTFFSCNEIVVSTNDGVYIDIDCDKEDELRVSIETLKGKLIMNNYKTIHDCDSCKYCDECTTDDMASCAHGANIGASNYEPKEKEN